MRAPSRARSASARRPDGRAPERRRREPAGRRASSRRGYLVTPRGPRGGRAFWLAQLRRSYPHVAWRLIREGEGTGNDSTATPRKRGERRLASPRDWMRGLTSTFFPLEDGSPRRMNMASIAAPELLAALGRRERRPCIDESSPTDCASASCFDCSRATSARASRHRPRASGAPARMPLPDRRDDRSHRGRPRVRLRRARVARRPRPEPRRRRFPRPRSAFGRVSSRKIFSTYASVSVSEIFEVSGHLPVACRPWHGYRAAPSSSRGAARHHTARTRSTADDAGKECGLRPAALVHRRPVNFALPPRPNEAPGLWASVFSMSPERAMPRYVRERMSDRIDGAIHTPVSRGATSSSHRASERHSSPAARRRNSSRTHSAVFRSGCRPPSVAALVAEDRSAGDVDATRDRVLSGDAPFSRGAVELQLGQGEHHRPRELADDSWSCRGSRAPIRAPRLPSSSRRRATAASATLRANLSSAATAMPSASPSSTASSARLKSALVLRPGWSRSSAQSTRVWFCEARYCSIFSRCTVGEMKESPSRPATLRDTDVSDEVHARSCSGVQ